MVAPSLLKGRELKTAVYPTLMLDPRGSSCTDYSSRDSLNIPLSQAWAQM